MHCKIGVNGAWRPGSPQESFHGFHFAIDWIHHGSSEQMVALMLMTTQYFHSSCRCELACESRAPIIMINRECEPECCPAKNLPLLSKAPWMAIDGMIMSDAVV